MRTILKTKQVKNLTEDEFQQCYKTNMGSNGQMRGDLITVSGRKTRARMRFNPEIVEAAYAVMIFNKANMELLGWALVLKNNYKRYHSTYTNTFCEFYVKRGYRRKGLGKRLSAAVLRLHIQKGWEELHVAAWNDTATGFFDSVGFTHSGGWNVKNVRAIANRTQSVLASR